MPEPSLHATLRLALRPMLNTYPDGTLRVSSGQQTAEAALADRALQVFAAWLASDEATTRARIDQLRTLAREKRELARAEDWPAYDAYDLALREALAVLDTAHEAALGALTHHEATE